MVDDHATNWLETPRRHSKNNVYLHGSQFNVLPRRVLRSSLAKDERIAWEGKGEKTKFGCTKTGARAKQEKNEDLFCFNLIQFTRGQNAEKALHTGTLSAQAKEIGL